MKKILFLASMSISMLVAATMSSCSENKTVTSDLEGEAASMSRLDDQPQVIVQGFISILKTRLAALGPKEFYDWSSDNHKVVKVDQKGVATGIGVGTAYIHVERLSYNRTKLESEIIPVTVTDIIPIPDKAFKSALVRGTYINKNYNNEIEVSEAIAFNGEINIRNVVVIKSLDGLKYFKNLKALNCLNTGITYLDVSGNAALESLNCSKCENLVGSVPGTSLPEGLNLTRNLRLTTVDCSQTPKLTKIGIPHTLSETYKNWTTDQDDIFTPYFVSTVER